MTTKDTKGVRQVLEDKFDAFNNNDWLDLHLMGGEFECAHLTDKALATLQEIMLGMLPEERDPEAKHLFTTGSGTQVDYKFPDYIRGFNEAIKLMEQNIRGGFNNGAV